VAVKTPPSRLPEQKSGAVAFWKGIPKFYPSNTSYANFNPSAADFFSCLPISSSKAHEQIRKIKGRGKASFLRTVFIH
jgi:hypothetical protein